MNGVPAARAPLSAGGRSQCAADGTRSTWATFTFLVEQQDIIDPDAAIHVTGQTTNAKVLSASFRSTTCRVAHEVTRRAVSESWVDRSVLYLRVRYPKLDRAYTLVGHLWSSSIAPPCRAAARQRSRHRTTPRRCPLHSAMATARAASTGRGRSVFTARSRCGSDGDFGLVGGLEVGEDGLRAGRPGEAEVALA
jgi:hypothetical protein